MSVWARVLASPKNCLYQAKFAGVLATCDNRTGQYPDFDVVDAELSFAVLFRHLDRTQDPPEKRRNRWRHHMKWAKPTIAEICIGLEINDYLPAEL